MSRYASFFGIADDDHDPECAKWTYVGQWKYGYEGDDLGVSLYGADGRGYKRTKGNPPCTCGNPAPVIYMGSHVQPQEDDPRGGSLDLAYMPDYAADPEGPVPFLRLGVAEDPSTYHGGEPGQADLVLDREQLTKLRDALTDWLEQEDWE